MKISAAICPVIGASSKAYAHCSELYAGKYILYVTLIDMRNSIASEYI